MMGSEEIETFRESDNGHDRGMRTETDARGNGHVSGRTGSEKAAGVVKAAFVKVVGKRR